MKKLVVYLLFFITLLTACTSKKDSNTSDISAKLDKETFQNTKDTTNNIEDSFNQKIITEVKDYILNGQKDKPEALKLKWSKTFLDEVNIESLYKDFLASGGKKDSLEDFAKYITESAPILNNWEELFKKDVYGTYQEEIVSIKHLEGDLYEGSIMKDGVETPYVVVSSRTGYYHGTSETPSDSNDNTNTGLKKQDYIEQLNKLKSNLEASSDKRYESPVTSDLIQAANEEYKLWDDKLNEIYSILKKQLPKDTMDKLTEEEIAWIKIRDENAEAAAKANEDGSIAPLNKVISLIESTSDRCFELVNNYMK